MKPFSLFLVFLAALVCHLMNANHLHASGFAIREQSAQAQGNAFAGATAGAEDVTYLFFNPAALGRLETPQTAGVLSFVAPRSKFRRGSASTGPFPPVLPAFPVQGSQDHDDIAEDFFVPAFYGMFVPGENLRFGLGINVPYGLESNYDRDWIGRYHAVESKLVILGINPVMAVRLTERVSIGLGFQAQYADAEISNAIDFGTIATVLPAAAGGAPVVGADPGNPAQDGYFKLAGYDWGYGWNAGLLIEPTPGTRLGFAYRSKIDHTFDGDADFSVPAQFDGAFAPTGLFRDTGAEAELTTPESWSAGFYQELGSRWAIMAELSRTYWNRFEQLVIQFDNPAQPDNITDADWKDTWFYALGVTFKPSKDWEFRTGVAYDESPVPDNTRIPRIPDEDRIWLSAGIQWRAKPFLTVSAGYTHIWVDDSQIDLKATDPGNAFRGDLTGEYENVIDIATFQLNWIF
ncbi:MAG: outer membrane protein transport protein [Syntrophotaleaceae bacterium]